MDRVNGPQDLFLTCSWRDNPIFFTKWRNWLKARSHDPFLRIRFLLVPKNGSCEHINPILDGVRAHLILDGGQKSPRVNSAI